ncbi:MAG: LPS assembly lipoprotein LptE [Tannerellaceae bacterium]|nr:LPS assembly lipoprotein LptE [Tannerellaceae bacterium]
MLRKYTLWLSCLFMALSFTTCSISYTFNQSTIDYNVIKTIRISDFPNQATLVSPSLSILLTQELKDKFSRSTRLEMVNTNADLEIEGEITGYNVTPMAVRDDAYSSESKLTITIRVRYFNSVQPEKDFEQSFSAYTTFDSNRMLTDIQSEVDAEIVSELIDQIYNSTVADW